MNVFAVDKDTLPPPDIQLEGIEAAGKETVPVTVNPPFSVCNPVNVFVVPFAA